MIIVIRPFPSCECGFGFPLSTSELRLCVLSRIFGLRIRLHLVLYSGTCGFWNGCAFRLPLLTRGIFRNDGRVGEVKTWSKVSVTVW